MKLVVHKFLLRKRGEVATIKLPSGAFVTKIDVQDGSPYAWVMLDKDAPYIVPYEFLIVATGQEIPAGYWVHSTFFEDGGASVWHGCTRLGMMPLEAHVHG